MGATEKDGVKKSDAAVVSQKSAVSVGSFRGWSRKRTMLLLICVLVVAAAVTIGVVHERNSHLKNSASQQLWETILKSSLTDEHGQQSVVRATTALLAGKQSGEFTIGATEQAQLYLDRANAYLDMGNYKKAADDYNKVAAQDGPLKIAALQGAVEAGYKAGERKELIPLYKELINLKLKSSDPMRRSVTAQYEENIQTLEQGGELVF